MHKVNLRRFYKTFDGGTSCTDFELVTSRFYIICWVLAKILIHYMKLKRMDEDFDYPRYSDEECNTIISYW